MVSDLHLQRLKRPLFGALPTFFEICQLLQTKEYTHTRKDMERSIAARLCLFSYGINSVTVFGKLTKRLTKRIWNRALETHFFSQIIETLLIFQHFETS